jgi:hypothetical protein
MTDRDTQTSSAAQNPVDLDPDGKATGAIVALMTYGWLIPYVIALLYLAIEAPSCWIRP